MIFDLAHPPSIIVPVSGTTPQAIVQEALAAQEGGADVVEFRADYWLAERPDMDVNQDGRELIREIYAALRIPVIFTVRTLPQGGQVALSGFKYRVLQATALDVLMQEHVEPDRVGVDIEFAADSSAELARRAADLGYTPVISHHDWNETPHTDLLQLQLEEMLELPGVIKLSVMAHSDDDVERLLAVTRQVTQASGRPIVTIAMGEAGVRSRLEGWRYGSVATFATVGAATAPGQQTVEQVRAAL